MEIANAKTLIQKLFDAMRNTEGADLGDGVRAFVPPDISLNVRESDGEIHIDIEPPVELIIRKAWGLIKLNGELNTIRLTESEVNLIIDGLPDIPIKVTN